MSMQEQPDDEAAREGLDRLFRKSAEEFNPPYDPAAWQLLNARLDEHDRIMAWGRVLRWGLAIMALVVLLIGGWYSFRQLGSKPALAGTEIAQRTTPKQPLPIDTQFPNPKIVDSKPVDSQFPNPKNVDSNPVASQPNHDIAGRHIDNQPMRIGASQQRRVVSWPVVRQQSLLKPEKLNNPAYPAESRVVSKNRVDVSRLNSTGSEKTLSEGTQMKPGAETYKPIDSSPKDYTTNAVSGDAVTVGSIENFRIGPVDALNSRDALHWPEWSELAIPAFAQTVSEPTGGQSSKPLRDRGLSVRLALSPDLSAIGLKNFARPGTNYGFLVEYRFNKRFSVQAGIIQSKKVYKATPEQYTWPARWAAWKVKPIGVQATCDMLDIPINLRYDFILRPMGGSRSPSRWFVSSGITTYVMKKEQFDYSYENPEDPLIRSHAWSTKTGRRFNFSNLNLSVGYERPIGRRFAWQVEPFVKMPLKQVGFFKINLLSTGAFLSVRYRL